MITGSVRLQGLLISSASAGMPIRERLAEPTSLARPEPAPIPVRMPPPGPQPSQGFVWAVSGKDLGTHVVGDRLATTLSASYRGSKVSDYALQAGTLPPDISLNPASGVLIGTLSAPGSYVFTIRARADGALSDASYSLLVDD